MDFKLTGDTAFGNLNGYNGAVSFAWYYNESGINESAIFPESLHYTNGSHEINQYEYFYSMGGGLGPEIAKKANTTGAVLTLYPMNSGSDNGTCRVWRFRVFVRKTPYTLTSSQDPEVYDQDYAIYDGFINNIENSNLDLKKMTRVELDRIALDDGTYVLQFRIGQSDNNTIELTDMKTLVCHKLSRAIEEDEESSTSEYVMYSDDTSEYSIDIDPQVAKFGYGNKCYFDMSVTAAWDKQPELYVYDFQ